MGRKTKIVLVLILSSAVWMGVLLRLGILYATLKPADGHLSWTFSTWERYPVSQHLFLMQVSPDGLAAGNAYATGTYPFLFLNFLILAPIHFLLGVPYNVAHNFLPYCYVLCLTLLLIAATRKQLLEISSERRLLLWFLVFIALGITITDPLPWTSSFNANRDNGQILTAGLFCYLSTWVFYDEVPKTPLLVIGIILALWAPSSIPSWILAGLFFQRTLKLERRWIFQVVGVVALATINSMLPRLVAQAAGIKTTGSGLLSRSGLNGGTTYMTSIPQAIFSPVDPRHWPTVLYFVLTALLALGLNYLWKNRKGSRPLQQAAFLLIPYATFAIFLPQLTSIHPYETDLFIFVPATFLMSFWSLQKPFWEKLSGRTYVAWFLFAGFILMSNLLSVAQMPRLSFIEGRRNLIAFVLISIAGLLSVGWNLSKRFLAHPSGNGKEA